MSEILYLPKDYDGEKETPVLKTTYDECKWKTFQRGAVVEDGDDEFIDDIEEGGTGGNA